MSKKGEHPLSYINPFCLNEIPSLSPTITWSSNSIPSMLPASTIRLVTSISSVEGVGSYQE